jgi:hypothetical protein
LRQSISTFEIGNGKPIGLFDFGGDFFGDTSYRVPIYPDASGFSRAVAWFSFKR